MINFQTIVQENVSRETFQIIEKYIEILLIWNKHTNLISRNLELNQIYGHIYDSILASQTIQDKSKAIVDVGTGAGLPGIIMTILDHKNMHLVDMDRKKVAFLREVSAHLNLQTNRSINMYHNKIEKMCIANIDYIISKAMTSISDLMLLTENISESQAPGSHSNPIFIVFKTKIQLQNELKLINSYNFKLQQYQNPYRNNSLVVHIQPIIDLPIK